MEKNTERMREGHMYRVINDEVVEVVRHGDEIIPITDPKVGQCVGQEVLSLYE